MIDALARAGAIVGEPRISRSPPKKPPTSSSSRCPAPTAACSTPGGSGEAKLDAYLDDYAYFVNALVTLYEATFDERWIDEAVRLADIDAASTSKTKTAAASSSPPTTTSSSSPATRTCTTPAFPAATPWRRRP